MALVPCRACTHQVDTSALACPRCGATDPGKKISRQQRDARNFAIQTVFWLCLFGFSGWYVWHNVIPMAKQFLAKPQTETTPAPRL
jgi:hypothetical protein